MMKNRVFHFLSLLVFLVFFNSCIHNGGNIGIWYGTWHVVDVTCEGVPVNYMGDYFFQFQGSIVRMGWQNSTYDEAECFGNWHEGDNGTFVMTFPIDKMEPLALPGITRANYFVVETRMASTVVLRMTVPEGFTYRYTLRKVI